MSDPNTLQADIAGVDPNNGTPQLWRKVAARHTRKIGDIVNDPARQAWGSTHNGVQYGGTFDAYEQMVTTAEQLAWVHTFSDGIKRDPGDILIELMEFAIQWRTANKLPTSAK